MNNSYMIIDIARCHGCNNCFMACKDEFTGNDFAPYAASQPLHEQRWINVLKRERGHYPMIDVAYLPLTCQHCENAACEGAGNGAVKRAMSGGVYFDTGMAGGGRELSKSCPYNAVWWNEEKSIAQKCQFCLHLTEGKSDEPRCVAACPTGALSFLRLEPDELIKLITEQGLSELYPQLGSKPHVLFRNLHRYMTNFIGGTLTTQGECLEGAEVSVKNLGTGRTEIVLSDSFGDFKADGLERGGYVLTIKHEGCRTISTPVELENESKYLGTIEITKN